MSFNNVIPLRAELEMPEKDPTAINVQADADTHRIAGTTYHGNIDFDIPAWSFIDRNLWQGGYVEGLRLPSHFKHVISLYPWEQYKTQGRLLTDIKVMMYDDDGEILLDQVDSLARLVNTCRQTGPTLVHCQAGLNRSSLIVARALYLQGEDGDDIVEYLRKARSTEAVLCNETFEAEVRSWHHNKRWINVGWCSSTSEWVEDDQGRHFPIGPCEAVMNLNGRPRAYYDLKQARRALPLLSRDTRIVELDFTNSTVTAKWVDDE